MKRITKIRTMPLTEMINEILNNDDICDYCRDCEQLDDWAVGCKIEDGECTNCVRRWLQEEV